MAMVRYCLIMHPWTDLQSTRGLGIHRRIDVVLVFVDSNGLVISGGEGATTRTSTPWSPASRRRLRAGTCTTSSEASNSSSNDKRGERGRSGTNLVVKIKFNNKVWMTHQICFAALPYATSSLSLLLILMLNAHFHVRRSDRCFDAISLLHFAPNE